MLQTTSRVRRLVLEVEWNMWRTENVQTDQMGICRSVEVRCNLLQGLPCPGAILPHARSPFADTGSGQESVTLVRLMGCQTAFMKGPPGNRSVSTTLGGWTCTKYSVPSNSLSMGSGNISDPIGYCVRCWDNASTLSGTKSLTSIRVVAALGLRAPPEFSTTENCPSSPRPAKLVGSPGEKTRQVVFSWATTCALRGSP